MTKVLTEGVRESLKEPWGRLIEGKDPSEVADEAWPGDEALVVAVGDVVTYHLLEAGHVPDVSIIDDRSMREETEEGFREGVRRDFSRSVSAENPPGHLTEDLEAKVEEALGSDGKVQVVVEGEEDIAVMPASLRAPVGSFVLYGQPDRGVVVLEVTEEGKREIRALEDEMEVIDGAGD